MVAETDMQLNSNINSYEMRKKNLLKISSQKVF